MAEYGRNHPEMVHSLLKSMQKGTRPLHAFCGCAKEARDVALMKLVPAIKRSLESLLGKCKALVDKLGGCVETGSLKNRNIIGEEISSQMFRPPAPEEEASEEEEDAGAQSDQGAMEEDDVHYDPEAASEEETMPDEFDETVADL